MSRGERRLVLLDENLPRQLAAELPEQDVRTVKQQGWSGVLNGELLRRLSEAGFAVFVTADRNLQHQQTIQGRSFGVVVLRVRRLKLASLLPLVPALRLAVATVQAGQVIQVPPPAAEPSVAADAGP